MSNDDQPAAPAAANPVDNPMRSGRVNVPIFCGDGLSSPGRIGVNEWCDKVDQVSAASGWEPEVTAQRAKFAMQGTAEQWLRNLERTAQSDRHNTWPALKIAVRNRFDPHTTLKELAELQTTLTQGQKDKNEDVATFFDRVTDAVLKFETLKPAFTASTATQQARAVAAEADRRDRDTQIIRLFVAGLKPHIRTFVNVLPHDTPDTVLATARAAESTHREQYPSKNPILPQVNALNGEVPSEKADEAATAAAATNDKLQAQVDELTAEVKKLTKSSFRGRSRGGRRGRGNRGGFQRGRGGRQGGFSGCYNCRGYGHYQSQCPSARRDQNQGYQGYQGYQQQQQQQQSQAVNTGSDWILGN